jgi:hypothetical protein
MACKDTGGASRSLQFGPQLPWCISGPDTSSSLNLKAFSRSQPLRPLLELQLLRHSLSNRLLCSCFVIQPQGTPTEAGRAAVASPCSPATATAARLARKPGSAAPQAHRGLVEAAAPLPHSLPQQQQPAAALGLPEWHGMGVGGSRRASRAPESGRCCPRACWTSFSSPTRPHPAAPTRRAASGRRLRGP